MNDKQYEELVEKYNYSYKIGKIVKGTVTSFAGGDVLVDISAKSTAICPLKEILYDKGQNVQDVLKIGEQYDFVINSQEDSEGIFYLSQKKVALLKNLEIIEEKFKNNEVLNGRVVSIVKGGIMVNVLGIKGFVPLSQLKNDANVDDIIELKVLSIDMEEGNFILSNKKVYNDSIENIKKEIFDKIELNMVVKGTVSRITDFGAFIDIGGIDGLLPLSQISWRWIDTPKDILENNQKIEVEIIGIDKEKQRISLSLKTLSENPWLKAADLLKDKKTTTGKVTRIKPFGAFVEVYPMVEGLLNRNQIKQYYQKYGKELEENENIEVEIKRFDVENCKINLEIV